MTDCHGAAVMKERQWVQIRSFRGEQRSADIRLAGIQPKPT